MTSAYDPFGSPRIDRTVIRPIPGGRVQDIPQDTGVFMPGHEQVVELERLGKLNPLESAASVLLALVAQLYNRPSHPSPQRLKTQLVTEVRHFQNTAEQSGITANTIHQASYALCSTIDEAIFNTPWGQESGWTQWGLLGEFHGAVDGGEGFFYQLQEIGQNPAQNLYLLELMYLCLALGFQGQCRIMRDGKARLEQVKSWTAELIRKQRGSSEKLLSPHWKGVKVIGSGIKRAIPLWVYYTIVAGVLLAIFLGLLSLLSVQASPIKTEVDAIAFQGKAVLFEPVRPLVDFTSTLEEALFPEIQAGLVTIHKRGGKPVIELRGDKGQGLFASGRDTLLDAEREQVVRKVADTLAMESFRPFTFTVMGYTDNAPIRNSIGFQDNRDLSRARAQTVEAMMKVTQSGLRLSVKGRGELDPVADNATREGRSRNRRVEIMMD